MTYIKLRFSFIVRFIDDRRQKERNLLDRNRLVSFYYRYSYFVLTYLMGPKRQVNRDHFRLIQLTHLILNHHHEYDALVHRHLHLQIQNLITDLIKKCVKWRNERRNKKTKRNEIKWNGENEKKINNIKIMLNCFQHHENSLKVKCLIQLTVSNQITIFLFLSNRLTCKHWFTLWVRYILIHINWWPVLHTHCAWRRKKRAMFFRHFVQWIAAIISEAWHFITN